MKENRAERDKGVHDGMSLYQAAYKCRAAMNDVERKVQKNEAV